MDARGIKYLEKMLIFFAMRCLKSRYIRVEVIIFKWAQQNARKYCLEFDFHFARERFEKFEKG